VEEVGGSAKRKPQFGKKRQTRERHTLKGHFIARIEPQAPAAPSDHRGGAWSGLHSNEPGGQRGEELPRTELRGKAFLSVEERGWQSSNKCLVGSAEKAGKTKTAAYRTIVREDR